MKIRDAFRLVLGTAFLLAALVGPGAAQTAAPASSTGTSPTNRGWQQSLYTYDDKPAAPAGVSGYAMVVLDQIPGGHSWPLVVNADGSITVAYGPMETDYAFGFSQGGIWRNGQLLVNNPAAYLYDDGYTQMDFNSAGWLLAKVNSSRTQKTGPYTSNYFWEQSIAFWPPDTRWPSKIQAPILASYNLDDSREKMFGSTMDLLSFDADLWTDVSVSEALQSDGNFRVGHEITRFPGINQAASVVERYFQGIDMQYPVIAEIFSSNFSGKYIGRGMDSSWHAFYFAGDKGNPVAYLPLSLNDFGSVLGDDDPKAFRLGKVYKGDRVAAWILQEAIGQMVMKPFVVDFLGQNSCLGGLEHATDIYVTGFDEAGNVYGSFAPAGNVIWVANPAAWGLPATTAPYTPIPWQMPSLPGNLLPKYGIRPRPDGIELTIASGTLKQFPSPANAGAKGPVSGDFPVALVPAQLRVDFNRDGIIETSDLPGVPDREFVEKDLPYCFWVNDDQDSGDTGGTDIPGRPVVVSSDGVNRGPDYVTNSDPKGKFETGTVHGTRDLVDYFPVYLDIARLLQALPSGAGAVYMLAHSEGALNFVYTDLTPATAGGFLRDATAAAALSGATTHRIPAEGIPLDADFLAGIVNKKGGVILLEGRAPTNQPLQLIVGDGYGNVIAEVDLPLLVSPVENMFRHLNLVDAAGAAPTVASRASASGWPDAFTSSRNFVFVHGYNVNQEQARGWQSEIFKRMFWSGSRAKFYGVTWYGSDSQVFDAFTYDYHINVVHAFQTAPRLAQFLNTLSAGGETNTCAHSLGNMAVLAALCPLKDGNGKSTFTAAKIDRHFAFDAAVPAEAIDGDLGSRHEMSHSDWESKSGKIDEMLWASEWYRLFRSSPNDTRGQLTWRNLFANLGGTAIYNFYSDGEGRGGPGREFGEEVLNYRDDYFTGAPTTDYLSWEQTRTLLKPIGEGSWYYQELMKGRAGGGVYGLTNLILGGEILSSDYGGWTFGSFYWSEKAWRNFGTSMVGQLVITPPSKGEVENFGIGASAQQSQPLFLFDSSKKISNPPNAPNVSAPAGRAVAELYGANGSYFVQEYLVKLLADMIPARTVAMGREAMPIFGPINVNNFDLSSDTFQDDWLSIRIADNTKNARWLHSDAREIAYKYTHPLFEKWVELGKLSIP